MNAPQRNDEPTTSSVLERVARLETEAEHACKDMGHLETRMSKRFDKIDDKIDDMPKILSAVVAGLKPQSTLSLKDWRVILAILGAAGLSVKPILDTLQ